MSPARVLSTPSRKILLLAVVILAGIVSGYVAVTPSAIRPLMATAAILGVLGLAATQPRSLIWLLFTLLPFLGLLRRLLIPVAGWSGTDPLLLVTPVTALCLIGVQVVRRPVAGGASALTKAITVFLAIAAVQTVNPLQGSPMVGLGGALVMIPPLFWFFVGNRLADDRLVAALLSTLKVIAVLVSAYGLYQTFYGLLPVEQLWVAIAGYNSLYVGSVLRAISTFVSGAEYVSYVSIAAAVCAAHAISSGKGRYLAPMVIYLPAIFLVSSRGPLVAIALVTLAVYASQAESWGGMVKRAVFAAAAGIAVVVLVLNAVALVGQAAPALRPLIDHQINGLLHPMNEDQSTAGLHSDMAMEGIWRGIRNPFGRGIGTITLAADKFGSGMVNWEVDVSNAFYALGVAGGLSYVLVIVLALRTAWGGYQHSRRPLLLAVSAVLLVTTREWWNGGHYVLPPLIWFLIGFMNRASAGSTAPNGKDAETL